jgi:hypothetical protein
MVKQFGTFGTLLHQKLPFYTQKAPKTTDITMVFDAF